MEHEEICHKANEKGDVTQGLEDVDAKKTKIVDTSIGLVNRMMTEPLQAPHNDNNTVQQRSSVKDSKYFGLEMREQDADWLEAMHINGGPNKTGMTPVLTSTSSQHSVSGVDDLCERLPPAFSLSMNGDEAAFQQSLTLEERTAPQSPTVKNKNKLIPYLPNNSPTIKTSLQLAASNEMCTTSVNGADKNVVNAIDNNPRSAQGAIQDRICSFRNTSLLENAAAAPLIPLRRSIVASDRPVLSGTIYEESTTTTAIDSQHIPDSSDVHGAEPIPIRNVPSLGASLLGSEHSVMMASKSKDVFKSDDEDENANAKHRRKITEVAQFADAVGDNALDLQIIEDDDDDQENDAHGDDDDDDATEIHIIHQQQRNVVGGLLPIKMRGSITHPAAAEKTGSSTSRSDSSFPPVDTTSSKLPMPVEFPETPVKVHPRVSKQYDSLLIKPFLQAETTESHGAAGQRITTTNSSSPSNTGFLAQLPTSASISASHDFVYKGIGANPPEIVKRGTTRGNYAQLHRKAWLEVTDKYHRYGKNLRLYYRFWESEGHPTNIFFDWLDSKGEAAGNELPELKECPRRQLDSDTVLYINNPDVTQEYAIHVVAEQQDLETDPKDVDGVRRGCMYDVDGNPVCTGPDGWIFVLRDNILYGAKKITSISGQSRQRFHHSSFFGGKAVAAAGIFITDDDGYLTRLYPHSGHYRPGEAHMQRVLFYLYHEGVDLRSFEIDTQQILHVARDGNDAAKDKKKDNNGIVATDKVTTEKKKKIEALHLMPAVYIACFLAHKARFIGEGIFAQIHQIRQSNVASVSEALAVIDNGGSRRKDKQ